VRIFEKESFRRHKAWMVLVVVATVCALGCWLLEYKNRSTLPGGSSRSGFAFGVIGGLIIIFESLLGVRKALRGWRLGRTRGWMIAHIWLGLLSVPLLFMHSGIMFGGTLSTILSLVFLTVIGSGIWGLWFQHWYPMRIYQEVPGETIVAQIPQVMRQHLDEVRDLVEEQCESLKREEAVTPEERMSKSMFMSMPDLSFSSGNIQGKTVTTIPRSEKVISGTRAIRQFFESDIAPYLEYGRRSKSKLANPAQAERMFRELENVTPTEAQGINKILKDLCSLRRQLDAQESIYNWLHMWLCVHLPLTIVLLVLMVVHIIYALRYW